MDETPVTRAISLVNEALSLIDEHGFGVGAAPHLDYGLQILLAEQASLNLVRLQPVKS
jgi:hypothetical protein